MIYRFGAFSVDPSLLELRQGDAAVALQPQVFALLLFLIENRDRVVTKDEIIEHVWDGRAVSDSTLNTRINALRKALGDSGQAQAIVRTIARRGFRFVADLDEADDSGAPAAAASPADHDRPSIAVLPFVNRSNSEEHEFFADGVTEDLITALSKLRGFFVTGRNTSFAQKNMAGDPRELAIDLGVRYFLEGSVRAAGATVRVTAQLTEAETGRQLWAERYDRQLSDIFAIQDEVTDAVLGRLAPELYTAEHERLHRRPPDSLDAWELFVRAMHLYSQQSRDSSAEALTCLERAITLDPDYAQALALYAITLSWRVIQRLESRDEALPRADELSSRAVAADVNDPWAHMGRGHVSMIARDSDEAIVSFRRALDLSPNFAYAHALLGASLAYAGQADAAIHHVDTALRLSPHDIFLDKFHVYHALAHLQSEAYGEAAAAAERAIRLRPDHANTHMLAAAAYALDGKTKPAGEALAAFTRLVPGTNAANVGAALAYQAEADRERITRGLRLAGLEG